MAELPDLLDRNEHVELGDHDLERWFTWAGVVVFVAFVAFALANVFGQKVGTTRATAAVADLELKAPNAVRSGLIYEVQFKVTAKRALEEPTLVLDDGWFDGFTINTFTPDHEEWIQRGGRNLVTYGPVAAGDELVVRFQYQVNPTMFGTREQGVALEDGGSPIVAIDHDTVVFP